MARKAADCKRIGFEVGQELIVQLPDSGQQIIGAWDGSQLKVKSSIPLSLGSDVGLSGEPLMDESSTEWLLSPSKRPYSSTFNSKLEELYDEALTDIRQLQEQISQLQQRNKQLEKQNESLRGDVAAIHKAAKIEVHSCQKQIARLTTHNHRLRAALLSKRIELQKTSPEKNHESGSPDSTKNASLTSKSQELRLNSSVLQSAPMTPKKSDGVFGSHVLGEDCAPGDDKDRCHLPPSPDGDTPGACTKSSPETANRVDNVSNNSVTSSESLLATFKTEDVGKDNSPGGSRKEALAEVKQLSDADMNPPVLRSADKITKPSTHVSPTAGSALTRENRNCFDDFSKVVADIRVGSPAGGAKAARPLFRDTMPNNAFQLEEDQFTSLHESNKCDANKNSVEVQGSVANTREQAENCGINFSPSSISQILNSMHQNKLTSPPDKNDTVRKDGSGKPLNESGSALGPSSEVSSSNSSDCLLPSVSSTTACITGPVLTANSVLSNLLKNFSAKDKHCKRDADELSPSASPDKKRSKVSLESSEELSDLANLEAVSESDSNQIRAKTSQVANSFRQQFGPSISDEKRIYLFSKIAERRNIASHIVGKNMNKLLQKRLSSIQKAEDTTTDISVQKEVSLGSSRCANSDDEISSNENLEKHDNSMKCIAGDDTSKLLTGDEGELQHEPINDKGMKLNHDLCLSESKTEHDGWTSSLEEKHSLTGSPCTDDNVSAASPTISVKSTDSERKEAQKDSEWRLIPLSLPGNIPCKGQADSPFSSPETRHCVSQTRRGVEAVWERADPRKKQNYSSSHQNTNKRPKPVKKASNVKSSTLAAVMEHIMNTSLPHSEQDDYTVKDRDCPACSDKFSGSDSCPHLDHTLQKEKEFIAKRGQSKTNEDCTDTAASEFLHNDVTNRLFEYHEPTSSHFPIGHDISLNKMRSIHVPKNANDLGKTTPQVEDTAIMVADTPDVVMRDCSSSDQLVLITETPAVGTVDFTPDVSSIYQNSAEDRLHLAPGCGSEDLSIVPETPASLPCPSDESGDCDDVGSVFAPDLSESDRKQCNHTLDSHELCSSNEVATGIHDECDGGDDDHADDDDDDDDDDSQGLFDFALLSENADGARSRTQSTSDSESLDIHSLSGDSHFADETVIAGTSDEQHKTSFSHNSSRHTTTFAKDEDANSSNAIPLPVGDSFQPVSHPLHNEQEQLSVASFPEDMHNQQSRNSEDIDLSRPFSIVASHGHKEALESMTTSVGHERPSADPVSEVSQEENSLFDVECEIELAPADSVLYTEEYTNDAISPVKKIPVSIAQDENSSVQNKSPVAEDGEIIDSIITVKDERATSHEDTYYMMPHGDRKRKRDCDVSVDRKPAIISRTSHHCTDMTRQSIPRPSRSLKRTRGSPVLSGGWRGESPGRRDLSPKKRWNQRYHNTIKNKDVSEAADARTGDRRCERVSDTGSGLRRSRTPDSSRNLDYNRKGHRTSSNESSRYGRGQDQSRESSSQRRRRSDRSERNQSRDSDRPMKTRSSGRK